MVYLLPQSCKVDEEEARPMIQSYQLRQGGGLLRVHIAVYVTQR